MKKLLTILLTLCAAANMAAPAFALDEHISAPGYPDYGKPTSVDVVYTADGGARQNTDQSKNAALIPPTFGSPSAYALNTGAYLTPNLAPGGIPASGAVINGSAHSVIVPTSVTVDSVAPTSIQPAYTVTASSRFTDVTDDLYYSDRHIATLKIPAIGVNVKVYQGTDSATLAKGAGHFEETSVWDGNVAIAGHNRGSNCVFGQIHTLSIGDRINYITKIGTRTYAVTSVSKISETDRSGLAESANNTLTLYTCVRDQSGYRWCVTAAEVS